MATLSVSNFIADIVTARGGPSNPTLYEFEIAPPTQRTAEFKNFFTGVGINFDSQLRFLNYLNNEIQIPGVTFQNSEIRQFHKGIPVKMASSKIYNEMDLTFICDTTSMPYKFFRAWIDWIGGVNENSVQYAEEIAAKRLNVSALRYYDDYTCDFLIKKLEKSAKAAPRGVTVKPASYAEPMNVRLIKAWPYSVASIPMSHASQNGLVKLSVSMYYEYSALATLPKSS